MLFSFSVRDGEEWPSDDDEDSDYKPGQGSDSDTNVAKSAKPKRKAAKKSNPKTQKSTSKKTTGTSKQTTKKRKSAECGADGLINKVSKVEEYSGNVPALPTELWERIFQFVVQKDGALPFLRVAPRVSQLWSDISARPYLWRKVDLSYGWVKLTEKTFRWLCEKRLSECQELNMTNCPVMSKLGSVQCIAQNLPQLKVLNLSRCTKLPTDSVSIIVNGCKHLEDLDLTSTTQDSVSTQTLCHVANTCGVNLRRLVVSNNVLRGFNGALAAIMDKCPNLEHLDISNATVSSGFISLDIEKLQRSCPKLRSLGLANTVFMATNITQRAREESPGFPDLEELSLAVTNDSICVISENEILRLLKGSTKLRLLDLRGCKSLQGVSSLEDIPAQSLEQLYLSRSAIITYDNLHQLVQKWRHSLTHLDLSWNTFRPGILEQALSDICNNPGNTPLHTLNLAGTPVNMDTVRNLLESVPNLCHLDLTSCRDVERGCKREYKTVEDIQLLRRSLQQ